MIDFIKENYMVIAAIAVFIAALIIMIKRGYGKQAKAIVLSLVAQAEERYGGGTGEIKFSSVAAELYERLPSLARILISRAALARMIESAVTKLKEILSK